MLYDADEFGATVAISEGTAIMAAPKAKLKNGRAGAVYIVKTAIP